MKKSAYLKAFVAEAGELLQSLNDSLISLEKEPEDLKYIEEIFRAAHSLKGMAATMEYRNMAGLTHQMESVLDLVRQRQRPVTEELVEIVFECLDALAEMMDAVSAGRTDDEAGGLIDKLARFGNAPAGQPSISSPRSKLYKVTVTLAKNCVLKSVRAYMVVKRLNHIGRIHKANPSLEDIEDEKFDRRFELELSSSISAEKVKIDVEGIGEVDSAEVVEITVPDGAEVKANAKHLISATESHTVRINIVHLDNLVNLVGELVILRSRLEKISAGPENVELDEVVQDLRHLTGDLQYEVMRTRMVPVGNIFSRFPRMVRDTAKELGKKVDLELGGSDIELDRTVLDEIGDPIVHLLRNAVGHGIEVPAERVAAGKPEFGVIKLCASREKDAVIIEISDDGSGLDPEKLKQKAVDMGLISPEQAKNLRDEEIFSLICRPGFTTAGVAGTLSGRGVGMDAAKGKVEALGGVLTISSEVGRGTKFTLELPLTLAIIQALMVSAAGRTYALPMGNVVEVSAVGGQEVKQVKDEQVMVVHDKIVPLVWLAETMGLAGDRRRRMSDCQVAIIRRGQEMRGLVVEELLGRSEIVVKPLEKFFGSQPGIGGVTILGDGRLALVIDVRTLN